MTTKSQPSNKRLKPNHEHGLEVIQTMVTEACGDSQLDGVYLLFDALTKNAIDLDRTDKREFFSELREWLNEQNMGDEQMEAVSSAAPQQPNAFRLLQVIPASILGHTLSFLDYRMLCRMRGTCRSLASPLDRAVRELRVFDVRAFKKVNRGMSALFDKARAGVFKHLERAHFDMIRVKDAINLLQLCPKLTRIQITSENSELGRYRAVVYPNIRTLRLRTRSQTDLKSARTIFPNVEQVDLDIKDSAGQSTLGLMEAWPELKCLRTTARLDASQMESVGQLCHLCQLSLRHVSADSLTALATVLPPTVYYLQLHFVGDFVGPQSLLKFYRQMKLRVTHLRLQGADFQKPLPVTQVPDFSLSLSSTRHVMATVLKHAVEVTWPTVRWVELCELESPGDYKLKKSLVECMPHIQTLLFSGDPDLLSIALIEEKAGVRRFQKEIFMRLRWLEELHLRIAYTSIIGQSPLAEVMWRLKRIYIRLDGSVQEPSKAVARVLVGYKRPESITFKAEELHLEGVGVEVVDVITKTHWPSVRRLSLGFTVHDMHPSKVRKLTKCFPRLEILALSDYQFDFLSVPNTLANLRSICDLDKFKSSMREMSEKLNRAEEWCYLKDRHDGQVF
eukprot:51906_1